MRTYYLIATLIEISWAIICVIAKEAGAAQFSMVMAGIFFLAGRQELKDD